MFLECQNGLPINLDDVLYFDLKRAGNRTAVIAEFGRGGDQWAVSSHTTKEEALRTLRALVLTLALAGECVEWKDVEEAARALAEEERRSSGEAGSVHRAVGRPGGAAAAGAVPG